MKQDLELGNQITPTTLYGLDGKSFYYESLASLASYAYGNGLLRQGLEYHKANFVPMSRGDFIVDGVVKDVWLRVSYVEQKTFTEQDIYAYGYKTPPEPVKKPPIFRWLWVAKALGGDWQMSANFMSEQEAQAHFADRVYQNVISVYDKIEPTRMGFEK
jgi:hypothetical protein